MQDDYTKAMVEIEKHRKSILLLEREVARLREEREQIDALLGEGGGAPLCEEVLLAVEKTMRKIV